MNNKIKQNTIMIVAIVLMVVAMVGASYAFFTINISNDNTPVNQVITTAQLTATFAQGNNVTVFNLYFLINEIDPALAVTDLKWELYLLGETNTLVNSGTFNGTSSGKTITLKTAEVVDPMATKNYSLRIYILETSNDQQGMVNKGLNGRSE